MSRLYEYYSQIMEIEKNIIMHEATAIISVAQCMANALKNNKKLFLFGCGHSHILVEEAFYRAGGLVPVHPIFDSAIMLHEGAAKSSYVEKSEKYGDWLFDRHPIEEGDILFIFSNSGINGCPVEMALRAKKAGAIVVAVSSRIYEAKEASRHSSRKRLCDFSDYVIDTHVPYGDALVKYNGQMIAPGSTIASAMIWNMLIAQLSEEAEAIGYDAEFFVSGNITGGQEKNARYIEKYRAVIENL
ncbi:MAG: sugar isomerase domain-containing protein [Butyricicoccus sp.]